MITKYNIIQLNLVTHTIHYFAYIAKNCEYICSHQIVIENVIDLYFCNDFSDKFLSVLEAYCFYRHAMK